MIEQTYKVLAGRTARMKSKSVKGEMLGYFSLRESKGTQLNIHTIRHQWQKLEALFVHLIQRISNYSCTPLVPWMLLLACGVSLTESGLHWWV